MFGEKVQGEEKHEPSVMSEAQFWLYESNECPSRWSQATGSALRHSRQSLRQFSGEEQACRWFVHGRDGQA